MSILLWLAGIYVLNKVKVKKKCSELDYLLLFIWPIMAIFGVCDEIFTLLRRGYQKIQSK